MLAPKKTKHRKHHQIKPRGTAARGTEMAFGSYGLKAVESRWITSRQLESARRVITKYMQRGGKMWIRVFPDQVITAKSGEIPMGKGKGAPDHFVAPVQRGRILFELEGIKEETAKQAIELAMHKLPVKCKFVKR